ncbi:ABC transporter permease [Methylococcus capsulatus]|uniref:ABC transporter family protein YhhJ n=1 Tax=Methylococcus capsulatus TaxID=414 RepID=A0AA35UCN0_METCP|nr:ABC transporter permease [Methylococcus capsulatus]CAI8759110.1 ABC transporter family protein YhhJ [Methylococcus capsulatus]
MTRNGGRLRTIFRLGLKELASLRRDLAMLALIVYGFTVMIYIPASRGMLELRNGAVAVVDEDRSALSRQIVTALPQPYFLRPDPLPMDQVDGMLDAGRYAFVIDIPPRFQADFLAGRQPEIQVDVDATAMSQAGIGAGYIERIIREEAAGFGRNGVAPPAAGVNLAIRTLYNPNAQESWFVSVMVLINVVNLLSIITSGAALMRERERGTVEHLLTLPLGPFEIVCAKIWANGLVVVVAVGVSLTLVVGGVLGVPLAGSLPLFLAATALYLFTCTAIGIFLATVARSMPQLGLLCILVVFPITTLSGNTVPLDSMPEPIQRVMAFFASTHYVKIAQAVLYRGAGFSAVWPQFLIMIGIGALFFLLALARFRHTVARQVG